MRPKRGAVPKAATADTAAERRGEEADRKGAAEGALDFNAGPGIKSLIFCIYL